MDLKILRDGDEKAISVTIGEFPADQKQAIAQKKNIQNLGFSVSDLTPDLQRRYDIDDDKGIVITNVEGNSDSYKAGLREGDVILKLDRKTVESVDDFYNKLEKVESDQPIALYIKRGDKKLFVAFTIPPNN